MKCQNCQGRGGFLGDEGCGCMRCPPEQWIECPACRGSGTETAGSSKEQADGRKRYQ